MTAFSLHVLFYFQLFIFQNNTRNHVCSIFSSMSALPSNVITGVCVCVSPLQHSPSISALRRCGSRSALRRRRPVVGRPPSSVPALQSPSQSEYPLRSDGNWAAHTAHGAGWGFPVVVGCSDRNRPVEPGCRLVWCMPWATGVGVCWTCRSFRQSSLESNINSYFMTSCVLGTK